MEHTRETLLLAAARLSKFQEIAGANGRPDDARILAVAADACASAAARYATALSLVTENPDEAKEIREAGFFSGCVAVGGTELGAECCLFAEEGICRGCSWKDTQWVYAGRVWECLCKYIYHRAFNRLCSLMYCREEPPDDEARKRRQEALGALAPKPTRVPTEALASD